MAKSKLTGGKKVNKAIKELQKIAKEPSQVKIGLPKDASPYPDGTSVIMVGLVNEFGSSDGKIPERSFLRAGISNNKAEFLKIWKNKLAKAILIERVKPRKVLGIIGQLAQAKVQEQIVEIKSPANAASTIDKKGSSNPLIDKGHMRQSIRYEVDD